MNSSSELEKETLKNDQEILNQENAQTVNLQSEKIDKEQITIDYLQNNPDFFNQHADIIADLEIPHVSGSVVSLIERQVAILREQNTLQKVHLAELVEIATENEKSNQGMHKLTLSLLDCDGIDACEVVLDEILCDDFSVDATALKLFIKPQPEQPEHLFIQSDSPLSNELEKLLNTRKPMCGFFRNLPLGDLFEDLREENVQALASVAVLPLYIEKNNCFGTLVLGSNNLRRFSADMGTVFLERLSETLSHVLYSFIKNS